MGCDDNDLWLLQIEAANVAIQNAQEGNVHSARRIIDQAIGALRGLMQFEEHDPSKLRLNVLDMNDPRRLTFHEAPDPAQLVYLRALLVSLCAIQSGAHPAEALHLEKPGHRLADPNIGLRNALLFIVVGEALDRLLERGATRMDQPVKDAIREAAKKAGYSRETVQKAWSSNGGAKGWHRSKADRK